MTDRPATVLESRDAPTLMQHARALQSAGKWAQAIPLYELARVQTEDRETQLQARLMVAFSCRMLQRYDEAAGVYRELADAAVSCGNVTYELDAELGLTKLFVQRQDFAAAARALDRLIVRARETGNETVLGKALADRAVIAGSLGHYVDAIRYGFEALPYAPDFYTDDAILHNVANAYREIGHAEAAEVMALTVVALTEYTEQRVGSLILLLNLAADAKHQLLFKQLRDDLGRCVIPKAWQAEVDETLARGKAIFATGTDPNPLVPVPLTADETATAEAIWCELEVNCSTAMRRSA